MESHGMVVKIRGKSCIVLTPEGEYREAPLPKGGAVKVGQEIRLEQRKSLPYLRHFMVAASLLIFILAGQLYLGQMPPAAAYLTIDINPSIELAVSTDKRVVSARGLNSDGEKVLTEVKTKGRALPEAVKLIIAQAVFDQYLKNQDDNVIMATLTVDSDAEPVVALDTVYEAIKNQVDSGGVDAEVIIEPVKPEMRQEAAKSGISTGRYLLLQRSSKKGVPVSISEISSMSLGKLEKEKKISFIELVDQNNDVDVFRDKKDVKVEEKGIYIERYSKRVNTKDQSGEEVGPSDKKQENVDNVKKPVPERTIKIYNEEKQQSPEQYQYNDNKRNTDDIGKKEERQQSSEQYQNKDVKRNTNDIGKSEHVDDNRHRDSHYGKGKSNN